jgi:hypothetical protein
MVRLASDGLTAAGFAEHEFELVDPASPSSLADAILVLVSAGG